MKLSGELKLIRLVAPIVIPERVPPVIVFPVNVRAEGKEEPNENKMKENDLSGLNLN